MTVNDFASIDFIFRTIDNNGDGDISREEFAAIFNSTSHDPILTHGNTQESMFQSEDILRPLATVI